MKKEEKKLQKERKIQPRTIHLKQSKGTASLYDWIHTFVFAVAVVVIVLTFFFRLVDVDGPSMTPTLLNNDKVIVTNFMYTPAQNDVIIISHGVEFKDPLVKRVIATEGQTLDIDFDKNTVTVDGKVLDEPYIQGRTIKEDAEIPRVIPEGKLFVMGDNRSNSSDSRSQKIGLIDVNDVIGKVQFVAFPFDRIKYIY